MFIHLTYDKIVDLVHVQFIYILLPQILSDGFIDVLLIEVIHLFIFLGHSMPESGMVVRIYGSGKVAGFSGMIVDWHLSL